MAEHARKLMSASEFLDWDDGTDTRYELIDGVPVAMVKPSQAHAQVARNLATLIERVLEGRRPCRVVRHGRLAMPDGESCYRPDLLVICEPTDTSPLIEAPWLAVEIDPDYGKTVRIPSYAALSSVQEIWLVSAFSRVVMVWRRDESGWRGTLPFIDDQVFPSRVLGGGIGLAEIFALTDCQFSPHYSP